ncbi:MAG: hypothetical protein H8E48_14820, partial [Chloroflexi bacterium]|nr:hypothetical protein [Chloroflexota bacterium]
MKSRSIVQEYPKVWISLIVTVLVTTVLMMASQITGGPTISYGYHGAGSAPQITASASERIAGKSDAKYSVDFTPDVTAPAQEITIQFPDGFTVASNPTVTSGRIGNGQAGSIQVQGGINYTPTISVTGQVVTLALPAPLDLTIAEGVQFQFTTGITNPTAIGLTGTFAVDSDASGQVSDNSLGVTIVHDAASQLGFGTEPVGGNRQTGQSTIGTQPVVQILDQFGNLVTTDPSGGSTESVTIAFQSGTNTEGSALSGTTSVNVSWPAGTATFTDLATDTVGTYNFTATDTNFSPNLTDVNSAAFSTNAATWYALASTGSDSNACLSTGVGNACLTIGGAMGKATIKGDTISAAAGTYAETVNITKPLTVQGAGITSIIQPSSGNAVEIRVSNITVDNLKIVG